MFRFTIRDVLWLTTLLAVCIAWRIESRDRELDQQSQEATRVHAERLREALSNAKSLHEVYANEVIDPPMFYFPYPEFGLADKPIP